MPNHVTNIVNASKEVIDSMFGSDGVDFTQIVPYPEGFDYPHDSINMRVETAARGLCGQDFEFTYEKKMYDKMDLSVAPEGDKDSDDLDQLYDMVKNKRLTGYYNSRDFNIANWGTKWNAYGLDDTRTSDTQVVFDTAWAMPEPVIRKLSEKFPEEEIEITYADEDLGVNCGHIKYMNGEEIYSNINDAWETLSDEKKSEWQKFACRVKGKDYEDVLAEIEQDEALERSGKFADENKNLRKLVGYLAPMYKDDEGEWRFEENPFYKQLVDNDKTMYVTATPMQKAQHLIAVGWPVKDVLMLTDLPEVYKLLINEALEAAEAGEETKPQFAVSTGMSTWLLTPKVVVAIYDLMKEDLFYEFTDVATILPIANDEVWKFRETSIDYGSKLGVDIIFKDGLKGKVEVNDILNTLPEIQTAVLLVKLAMARAELLKLMVSTKRGSEDIVAMNAIGRMMSNTHFDTSVLLDPAAAPIAGASPHIVAHAVAYINSIKDLFKLGIVESISSSGRVTGRLLNVELDKVYELITSFNHMIRF